MTHKLAEHEADVTPVDKGEVVCVKVRHVAALRVQEAARVGRSLLAYV